MNYESQFIESQWKHAVSRMKMPAVRDSATCLISQGSLYCLFISTRYVIVSFLKRAAQIKLFHTWWHCTGPNVTALPPPPPCNPSIAYGNEYQYNVIFCCYLHQMPRPKLNLIAYRTHTTKWHSYTTWIKKNCARIADVLDLDKITEP